MRTKGQWTHAQTWEQVHTRGRSVRSVAREEGVSEAAIYHRLRIAREAMQSEHGALLRTRDAARDLSGVLARI